MTSAACFNFGATKFSNTLSLRMMQVPNSFSFMVLLTRWKRRVKTIIKEELHLSRDNQWIANTMEVFGRRRSTGKLTLARMGAQSIRTHNNNNITYYMGSLYFRQHTVCTTSPGQNS